MALFRQIANHTAFLVNTTEDAISAGALMSFLLPLMSGVPAVSSKTHQRALASPNTRTPYLQW